MQRSKNLLKKSAADLKVSRESNFRDEYDLPAMMESIIAKRKILEPVFIERGTGIVLRGNRRILAAQELLKDKNLPEDIRKALENVECYECWDMEERERTEFILDHGSQKPLSRVETAKAVKRLVRQMLSEKEIASLLYMQLARFTGKSQKAWEASQLPAGPTRDEFVRTWLHGTLGNFLLPACAMGDEVWTQFVLTETENDRKLSKDEEDKRTFTCDRSAVKRLNSAKAKDRESKGWDATKGGDNFNAELAKLKDEFRKPKAPKTAITHDQMLTAADAMQSGIGLAYKACAGKLSGAEKSELEMLDAEYGRRDKVFPVLKANLERITDESVKALIDAILNKGDEAVAAALAPYLPK